MKKAYQSFVLFAFVGDALSLRMALTLNLDQLKVDRLLAAIPYLLYSRFQILCFHRTLGTEFD